MWGFLVLALVVGGVPPENGPGATTVVFVPRANSGVAPQDGDVMAATAAMRDSSVEHWQVMVFPPQATALADAFVAFARHPGRPRDKDTFRDSDDAFLVNGPRFFRLVEVSRVPADEESLEIWSDGYPPIVLRRFSDHGCLLGEGAAQQALCRAGNPCPDCVTDEPTRISTLPDAPAARFVSLSSVVDLRPVFAGFLRSQGFAPIVDLEAGPDVKLVRTGVDEALRFVVEGGPLAGRILSLKTALTTPERDNVMGSRPVCTVEDFSTIRVLPVTAVGRAGHHHHLAVRLSLGWCDWEAGGCACRPGVGPDAIERLVVVPPTGRDAALISRQRRRSPSEGPR